jgi:hypothetical protein
MNDAHIKALQAEYAEYTKAKKTDRAKQAEAELARYGVEPKQKGS